MHYPPTPPPLYHLQLFEEEIFGPVVAMSVFDDEEEVVVRANNTRAGKGWLLRPLASKPPAS